MIKIIIAVILVMSALFAGCLSENKKLSVNKDIIFEIKPVNISAKNNESIQVKIYINNTGKSIIHPVVRFNTNSSDKPYVDFGQESYDMGSLRPGEDSGFRIVDIKARLAAGTEIKYQVRAEVVNDGAVLESKDLIITVKR